ncbi:hypothetical protein QSV34_12930 [Porticoccus sp. W117]|uniref:hypothetical protein n=1 Tax=Porticoccus sp. W117 TaxID=3054777 RepID=UPI00259221BD|nr:hypothetical protein [Porticoccus sp. W117]MDM3872252.1 hypothetical protein [Porticoccus sp. W117]
MIEVVCYGCGAGVQFANWYFSAARPYVQAAEAAYNAYAGGNLFTAAFEIYSAFVFTGNNSKGSNANSGSNPNIILNFGSEGDESANDKGGPNPLLRQVASVLDGFLNRTKSSEGVKNSVIKVNHGTVNPWTSGNFANGASQDAFLAAIGARLATEREVKIAQFGGIDRFRLERGRECVASCHGVTLNPNRRPATPKEEALLTTFVISVATIPISGGAGVLLTSGRVIHYSVKAKNAVEAAAIAGRLKAIQAANAVKVYGTNAAYVTFSTVAPVASSPVAQQFGIDVLNGYLFPTPPAKPGELLGFILNEDNRKELGLE